MRQEKGFPARSYHINADRQPENWYTIIFGRSDGLECVIASLLVAAPGFGDFLRNAGKLGLVRMTEFRGDD